MELLLTICLLTAVFALISRLIKPALRRSWSFLLVCTVACLVGEFILLLLLPHFRLSFGPVGLPMFLFSSGHLFLLLLELWLINLFKQYPKATLTLAIALQVSLFLMALDGLYFEPFRLTLTRQVVPAPQFLPEHPLRILQISDLHVERITQRDQSVIDMAKSLEPDMIVLTGDYVNLDYIDDETALADARKVVSQFDARYGVYAITGSVDGPHVMATVFKGLKNVHVLDDRIETFDFPGGKLSLLGVSLRRQGADRDALKNLVKRVPAGAYTLLLYHPPDLIETASAVGIDLYLAGHTHGGQVRLPFYGAVITASRYGKQYEMGAYTVGKTRLYVSRGLGAEGFGMPRLRFLCPPELVLFELGTP